MPRPRKLKVAPPCPHEDITPSPTPVLTPRLPPPPAPTGIGCTDANNAVEEPTKAQETKGATGSNAAVPEEQRLEEGASKERIIEGPPHQDGKKMSQQELADYVAAAGSLPVDAIAPSLAPMEEAETEVEVRPAREDCKCFMVLLLWLVVLTVSLIFLVTEKDKFIVPDCSVEDRKESPPKKCEPCGTGTWVVPIGGEMEQTWPSGLRATLYFLGLVWCFLGMAIVCDQFMAAIEEVTSKTKSVWVEGAGHSRQKMHLRLWNDTMANLTLMALGSSAPEILLNLLELIGNDFFSGQLGPSTIVGSAAFNLLVITGVCITAIPEPRCLKVVRTEVFAVTAIFSILAYFWLIITLGLITPDKVDIWEAVVTFALFPLLLIIAFAADKGLLRRLRCMTIRRSLAPNDVEVKEVQQKMKDKFGKAVSFENVKTLLRAEQGPMGKTLSLKTPRLTRLAHRRSIMRSFTGQRRDGGANLNGDCVAFGFSEHRYVVLECAGEVLLPVVASKIVPTACAVRFKTSDIDAAAGQRYEAVEGWLKFEPGDREKSVKVPIIDNDTWEPTQLFSCDLIDITILQDEKSRVSQGTGSQKLKSFKPGNFILRNASTKVAILNDDEPGTLAFRSSEVTPIKNAPSITLVVDRLDGVCGDIRCHYESRDGSAVQGFDYDSIEGDLHFTAGQEQQTLKVPINQTAPHPDDRSFYVVLNDPTEGVLFDPETSGGAQSAICEVILAGEPGRYHAIRRICGKCFNRRRWLHVLAQWREQFVSAVYVGGCREDQARADAIQWIFHVLSVVWKIMFSLTPPPKWLSGWPCFCVALGMIGIVTMLVSDLAGLLGCCLGMPEDICAITLVALGTSLPDTLASKSAAESDDSADNSVGNVTGSNSVNVFLGMGLPWTLGAIYWELKGRDREWQDYFYKGRTFQDRFGQKYPSGGLIVPAESLALSVTVFTCSAVACLGLLQWRRLRYGGELGGPQQAQYRDSASLIVLWFCYIGASVAISVLND